MIICIVGIGGLCNRMRTMAGAIKLAKEWNTPLFFIWLTMPDMNASFSSLFKKIDYKVIDLRGRRSLFRILNFIKKMWPGIVIDDDLVYKHFKGHDRGSLYRDSIRGKNVLIWSCENITDSTDYSMFVPVDRVQDITKDIINNNTIGIHIRRTDNIQSLLYSPTELFEDSIRKELLLDPTKEFYLATDDTVEEQRFLSCFGNRIKIYKKRSLDRNDPIGIEDALIDLNNLSHCRHIFGSYCSSFSDVAADWGNIKKYTLRKEK